MLERFKASDVEVEGIVYPGTAHSFLEAVSIADVAVRAFEDSARWIREHA